MDKCGKLQQESSSSSGIFKLLDPASSATSVGGATNTNATAAASTGNSVATSEQESRKRNLNYRFHFLESDEDDMLSAGSSVGADRSTGGASGGDENTHSGAVGVKFGRYREAKKINISFTGWFFLSSVTQLFSQSEFLLPKEKEKLILF